jgi:hypothetical protein
MTTEAIVDLAPGRPLPTVHAETPAGRATFGFSADLNEAMGDALDAMVTWLAAIYRTSKPEAPALAECRGAPGVSRRDVGVRSVTAVYVGRGPLNRTG